eukprot:scaffold991_cov278-Amphora_coffeaeformis.AAC.5
MLEPTPATTTAVCSCSSIFRPRGSMMFSINKHVKKVNDGLHRPRNTQRHGRSNESHALPMPHGSIMYVPKGPTQYKDPIQAGIDEQKQQVIVHGRPGQSLGLKVESHALVQPIGDGPQGIVLGVRAGHGRHVGRKAQRRQAGLNEPQGRETRQHGHCQPKHALLQPNTGHAGIATTHGLSHQGIQYLIKGQGWRQEDTDAHVGQDRGRQVRLGRMLRRVNVSHKGRIGTGHTHATKKANGQGPTQM